MKKDVLKNLVAWLPLGFAITVICALIYVAVHQDLRQAANDPQIQTADDVVQLLASGTPINESLQNNDKVDMANSLDMFIMTFDSQGKQVASDAVLDGQSPTPPAGVFDTSKWGRFIIGHHLNLNSPNQNRITWQPKPGVRIAAVIEKYAAGDQSGFVLVGRSLSETEKRAAMLAIQVLGAWIVAMAGSLILYIFRDYLKNHV